MKNINLKKGFSLLELLVVISIIVILVGLGTVSYSTAQKKARDARRKSDLRAIQAGLEQYYSICGSVYPASIAGGVVCAAPATTIIDPTKMPRDPKTGALYTYTPGAGNSSFTLSTSSMESEANPYSITSQQ